MIMFMKSILYIVCMVVLVLTYIDYKEYMTILKERDYDGR